MQPVLKFPNPSRTFDVNRNAVRFVGYEAMVQVLFFVEAEALSISGRRAVSEVECLNAFDASRGLIHEIARKAYSRSKSKPCILTVADF